MVKGAQGLFEIDGYPNRSKAVSGMAHFSGGGPNGAVCGKCQHYGTRDFEQKCVKHRQMAGEWGANVRKSQSACKYFEEKPRA